MLDRRALLRTGMSGICGAMWGSGTFARGQDPGPGPAPAVPREPLKITRVETFALRHKLPKAIGPSTVLYGYRDALLVKLTGEGGLTGWGETADVGGTRGVIENHLRRILLGANALEHRPLWRRLWGANFGDGRAVGAVDMALQDLRGKALGLSIADLHGGRHVDRVMAYAAAMNYTEGVRPEDQHPAEAAALVKRGFRALKLRTGRYGAPRDIAVLEKVRATVGDDIRLMTDGNGAFTVPQAVKFAKQLEKLDFYYFEEPLPQGLNYAGYDELTRSCDMAIAGGEVLDSRSAARDHIARRSFDIIQPDVALCGGIDEVLFIAEMARLWSIPCIPHCWAGAIAMAATLQTLALLPPNNWGHSADAPMLEHDTYENPFRDEILTKPLEFQNGHVTVPTGPGLGIEVNEEVVKKYLVRD